MLDILAALGLVLAIEGLVYAAFPEAMKSVAGQIANSPAAGLRYVGLGAAVFGVALVWFVRG
jgi:uncharacterized protein YjeT (DUF2065 family)